MNNGPGRVLLCFVLLHGMSCSTFAQEKEKETLLKPETKVGSMWSMELK